MIEQTIKIISAIIAMILAYEIIRFIVKDTLMKRLYRSVRQYIAEYNIKLDKYKFMNKFIVKQELMNDDDIHNAILVHARENGMNIRHGGDEIPYNHTGTARDSVVPETCDR
ncbi:MAG TPA: hypothetical protein PLM53_04560 [Spirochaetota bacterium]|nr:hypothetical protein [Spirochaetota bacterium]HPC42748.1 hypothetical protein [Spirochaetota bacterium]HPL17396.1 hypothetical protein [Spirochaetota bacterium]HQF07617.1 hypothetical protein [Spirochaetota bacterium]HQH96348.1 hypothetical protein [Spirochaetota bacterium]